MDPIECGGPIEFACFHPTGDRVLVMPAFGRPVLFSVPTGPPVLAHTSMGMEIKGIRYSPDGDWLAVQSRTNGVHVLGTKTLKPWPSPDGSLASVHVTAWTDHDLLAALPDGRVIRCLPGTSNQHPAVAFKAGGTVAAMAVSTDGSRVATITTRGCLELWDARQTMGQPIASQLLPDTELSHDTVLPEGITHFAFSRSGTHLVMSLMGGRAVAWGMPGLEKISLEGVGAYAHAAALHPTRPEFVLGDFSGKLMAWRLDQGLSPEPVALDNLSFVGRAAFDSSGRHLLLTALHETQYIRAWPPVGGMPHKRVGDGHAWHVQPMPGEDVFVHTTDNGSVQLRSIPHGWLESQWKLPGDSPVNWLSIAPDRSRLAAAMNFNSVGVLPIN
jgi:hypothetical protein